MMNAKASQAYILFLAAAALLPGALLAAPARADDPLMGKKPWDFAPQNRAAIAIAIKNAEDPLAGGQGGGAIVCGGNSGASGPGSTGSAASATANSSCIILNNSPGGSVHNDQNSHGDQTASSDAQTKTGSGKGSGSIDEVASILGGNRQGL